MPLTAYKPDSLTVAFFEENKNVIPLGRAQDADLPHELTNSDFETINFNWLRLTFDSNLLWYGEPPELKAILNQLADFLREQTVGPYYVHEGYRNTRTTYGVILLDTRDVKAFATQFPEWKFHEKSADQNLVTIQQAIWKGWKPESLRMQKFCAEMQPQTYKDPAIRVELS